MLSHLIIKNFILIEETCLPFSHHKVGLHILTGQAGAGKSIILQALQGVFGYKISSKNAEHLALKENEPIHLQALCYSNDVIHEWLMAQKLPLIHQKKHQLVLERFITKNPKTHKIKNKYLINDVVVSQEQVQQLGQLMMIFQGQHAQQILLDATQHGRLFDECVFLTALQEEVENKANKVITCRQKIQSFEQMHKQYEQQKEHLLWEQSLFQEINTKNQPLTEELWEQLNKQQKELQAQFKLQQTLQQNYHKIQNIYDDVQMNTVNTSNTLNTSSNSIKNRYHHNEFEDADFENSSSDTPSFRGNRQISVSMAQKVSQIHQDLQQVQKNYLWLDPVLQHLEEIMIHFEEVDYLLAHQLQHLTIDSETLNNTEQTLQKMWSIARQLKTTPAFLYERFIDNHQKLKVLKQSQDLPLLQQELIKAEKEYHQIAQLLSQERLTKKTQLESMMQEVLTDLGLNLALFQVVFIDLSKETNNINKDGYEKIQFYFDAQGHHLQPLQNVASGGELSRIHLALCLCQNILQTKLEIKNKQESQQNQHNKKEVQSIQSNQSNQSIQSINPLLVFDEIDTGLSGEMAEKVGKVLKKLGEHRQILCITHLPQVAGFADVSIQIEKIMDKNDEVRSILNVLQDESAKINSLAELLGGDKITATLHAQNLLR